MVGKGKKGGDVMKAAEMRRILGRLKKRFPNDHIVVSAYISYYGSIDKTSQEKYSLYVTGAGWTSDYEDIRHAIQELEGMLVKKEEENE